MENRSSQAVADFFATMLQNKVQVESLPVLEEVAHQPIERLLAQVSPLSPVSGLNSEIVDAKLLRQGIDETEPVIVPLSKPALSDCTAKAANPLQNELSQAFPVLYFSVAEYTFAVPLIKLKGIYRLNQPTKIFGKPDWFSGIQVEREKNIGIVDTAKYLMPKKFNSQLESSTNYKYIIVLGDSDWGLKCDNLVDSEDLCHDDIKWRTGTKMSPWLAGTVKQRMCGLLAVDALVELFEQDTTGK